MKPPQIRPGIYEDLRGLRVKVRGVNFEGRYVFYRYLDDPTQHLYMVESEVFGKYMPHPDCKTHAIGGEKDCACIFQHRFVEEAEG